MPVFEPILFLAHDIGFTLLARAAVLLQLVEEVPILYICAFREYRRAPAWQVTASAQAYYSHHYTEIRLHPLTEQESDRLIASLLAIDDMPPDLRRSILKKTEGNPLFVEEVIRMLIDRELIVPEKDHWAAQEEIETTDIPDNLQGLLLARIDRLPDDVKHTLRVASVIGRQFSVTVLEEVQRSVGQ